MAERYVPVFYDWVENTSELTAEEKGRLIDALVLYARGDEYHLSGNERFVFPVFKAIVDRSKRISDVRVLAGATGGQAKSCNRKQTVANDSKPKQTVANVAKSTEEEEEEEEEEEKEDKSIRAKSSRFCPPTLEEVKAYCQERKKGVDPEKWFNFYAAKGWMVGKNKMKDWRAAVRTWESDSNPIPIRPAKTVIAQQYEQRDYSAEQESLEEMVARLEGRSG